MTDHELETAMTDSRTATSEPMDQEQQPSATAESVAVRHLRLFVDAWGEQSRDVMQEQHGFALRVSDVRRALDLLDEFRKRDEAATRVIERLIRETGRG